MWSLQSRGVIQLGPRTNSRTKMALLSKLPTRSTPGARSTRSTNSNLRQKPTQSRTARPSGKRGPQGKGGLQGKGGHPLFAPSFRSWSDYRFLPIAGSIWLPVSAAGFAARSDGHQAWQSHPSNMGVAGCKGSLTPARHSNEFLVFDCHQPTSRLAVRPLSVTGEEHPDQKPTDPAALVAPMCVRNPECAPLA